MNLQIGKYKGQKIESVIGIDPQYIVWAWNQSIISLTKKQLDKAIEAKYAPKYFYCDDLDPFFDEPPH